MEFRPSLVDRVSGHRDWQHQVEAAVRGAMEMRKLGAREECVAGAPGESGIQMQGARIRQGHVAAPWANPLTISLRANVTSLMPTDGLEHGPKV